MQAGLRSSWSGSLVKQGQRAGYEMVGSRRSTPCSVDEEGSSKEKERKRKRNHDFKSCIAFFPSRQGSGNNDRPSLLDDRLAGIQGQCRIRRTPKPREGLVPGRESGKYCTWGKEGDVSTNVIRQERSNKDTRRRTRQEASGWSLVPASPSPAGARARDEAEGPNASLSMDGELQRLVRTT